MREQIPQDALQRLVEALRCLPGVGPKSAQRMAFYLLQHDRNGAAVLAQSLDRKSTRLNSSHSQQSRMPSSA